MFKKIAAVAALVIASSSAFAQQAPQFYVGGEVASTKIDGFKRDEGAGVYFGYNFNQNFAVEAGWSQLAEYKETAGEVRGKATFEQTSISLIGTQPLSNGFSVYGRLGYNQIKAKVRLSVDGESGSGSDDLNKAVYGLGLAYTFAPAITGRIEVQKPHSEITKVAVGVAYNF
ncbi:outer membrane beta-barrel protein [Massilia sp. YIM B02769]|uniref:outer membrane beta-barrel protein n=1 Tax=Massilia sp. YIM B02769 TaxID=3050129 RepID=UPI0025B62B8B|nr:outer membrane beta-barrel protein [Massilia sp. YIM B02769]MDN4058423.1 outer membrane beta-barrel protein [Massilia sp. YIM B02769]